MGVSVGDSVSFSAFAGEGSSSVSFWFSSSRRSTAVGSSFSEIDSGGVSSAVTGGGGACSRVG